MIAGVLFNASLSSFFSFKYHLDFFCRSVSLESFLARAVGEGCSDADFCASCRALSDSEQRGSWRNFIRFGPGFNKLLCQVLYAVWRVMKV